MTKFYARLLTVFTVAILLSIGDASAQVSFNIRGVPGTSDYLVSMTPTVSYSGPPAFTPSLQITIRVPHGTNAADLFNATNILDQTGNGISWIFQVTREPVLQETPPILSEFDYFYFTFSNSAPELPYVANTETVLFRFTNSGACITDEANNLDVSIMDNLTDPFKSPNLLNIGTNNTISTLGSNGAELFEGDYLDGNRDCSIDFNFPVEWLAFNATPVGSVVDIEWATANEENNKFFSVERSVDGRLFQEIVRVPGQGNSNEVSTYKEVDTDPIPGYSYYRLRQVDFDAGFSYSEIVEVFFDPDAVELGIQVYPNPSTQSEGFTLEFDSPEEQYLFLELYSTSGQIVYKKLVEAKRGRNEQTIPANGLTTGVYHLRLYNDQQAESTQVIIK
ncbi:MAG: T9SS type A sorting domain-containing protein [Bacteroidia bacterium]